MILIINIAYFTFLGAFLSSCGIYLTDFRYWLVLIVTALYSIIVKGI